MGLLVRKRIKSVLKSGVSSVFMKYGINKKPFRLKEGSDWTRYRQSQRAGAFGAECRLWP
jgi:hypothetical protein